MRIVDDNRYTWLTMVGHARTEKAIFVSETGDKADAVWLPLSQIELVETGGDGIYEVTLPEWLAIEKGIS